jgi:hypothetical protein
LDPALKKALLGFERGFFLGRTLHGRLIWGLPLSSRAWAPAALATRGLPDLC